MTQVKPSGQEGPPPAYPPPPMAYNPAPVGAYPPQQQPPPPGYHPHAYGAQQPGYPPPQQQAYGHTSTTVVVQQPGSLVLAGGQRFYATSATVQCQHCQATVTTSTSYTVGTYAWLIAFIICFVGCWAGCCLIPFCVDGCKDVVHSCPNCRCVVGRYSRL